MRTPQPRPRVAAVILAAGGSARIGSPKQLLPIAGQPMVRRVVQAVCAANLAEVVVVIGADADLVRTALTGLPVRVLENEEWASGMSTSLRAGIGALGSRTEAALVVLADHPGLTPALIGHLIECYSRDRPAIVVPVYRGRRGHPVLFDRVLFHDLVRLEGDVGARSLLDRAGASVIALEVDDPAVVRDIDTREEYEALGEELPRP